MADEIAAPPGPVPPPAPPPPPPAPPPLTPGQNKVLMLVLAYLGLLALIPLVVERNDREVQWHAKHGLVLLAAEVVLYFGLALITWFMPLLGVFFFVLTAGIFVLHLAAILKAVKGERLLIPGLSDYADRF